MGEKRAAQMRISLPSSPLSRGSADLVSAAAEGGGAGERSVGSETRAFNTNAAKKKCLDKLCRGISGFLSSN